MRFCSALSGVVLPALAVLLALGGSEGRAGASTLPEMKVAKIRDLQIGTHVRVHPAGGGSDGVEEAVVEADAVRGEYRLRLRDGSMMSAVRERLELDPKTYPDGGVFVRNGFPLRFQVQGSIPDRAQLLAAIENNGGQVVIRALSDDDYIVHPGPDKAIKAKNGGKSGKADANVISSQCIWDSINLKTFVPLADPVPMSAANKVGEEVGSASADAVDGSGSNSSQTRRPYTPEEDTAILAFLQKKRASNSTGYVSVHGNKVWQEAAEAQVCPGRPWASMKQRFKAFLEIRWHNLGKDMRGSSESRVRSARGGAGAGGAGEDVIVVSSDQVEGDGAKKRKLQEEEESAVIDEGERARMRAAECMAELDRLVKVCKVPRSVVVHAGMLCSGDMAMAQRYLEGEDIEAWEYEDDKFIIDEEDYVRASLEQVKGMSYSAMMNYIAKQGFKQGMVWLLARRGHEAVHARCNWIHDSS